MAEKGFLKKKTKLRLDKRMKPVWVLKKFNLAECISYGCVLKIWD